MTGRSRGCLGFLVAAALAGCATERPVIYPSGGGPSSEAQIQADIEECIELANANGATSEGGTRVATRTVKNSAIGAGTGAVVGAIAGDAGRGAAIGAASTGVGTLLRSAFESSEPSAIHKRFVARCLKDKGHSVIGWR